MHLSGNSKKIRFLNVFFVLKILWCVCVCVCVRMTVYAYIEGSQPERCISIIYHAWDTPFWSGTLSMLVCMFSCVCVWERERDNVYVHTQVRAHASCACEFACVCILCVCVIICLFVFVCFLIVRKLLLINYITLQICIMSMYCPVLKLLFFQDMEQILRTIADNFISERNSSEVMAVG